MKTIDHYEIREAETNMVECYFIHSDFQSRAETLDMQGIQYTAWECYEDMNDERVQVHDIGYTPWQVKYLKEQMAKLKQEEEATDEE